MKIDPIMNTTQNQEPTPDAAPTLQAGAERADLSVNNLLVPVDFSEPSKKALDYATLFARKLGARITLLSVIEDAPFAGLEENPLAITSQELEAKVKASLAGLGARLVGQERLEAVLVRAGQPFEEIIKAARALKTDLIIIATHGYTGLRRVVLGSTAERVVRLAPCPVLTVRRDEDSSTE